MAASLNLLSYARHWKMITTPHFIHREVSHRAVTAYHCQTSWKSPLFHKVGLPSVTSVCVSRYDSHRVVYSESNCKRNLHSTRELYSRCASSSGALSQSLCRTRYANLTHTAPVCRTIAENYPTRADIITIIDTEEDFDTFLAQLQSKLHLDSNSRAHERSLHNLRPLAQRLVMLDCDTRNIVAMLATNPGILMVQSERLVKNIDFLQDLGLNWGRLVKALDQNSSLWTASVQQLQGQVKQLRKLGFVEGSLQKVVSEWSEILTISSTKLKTVVKTLMEKCGFSKADVVTILSDSPAILVEDPESIELKFQYVYFRMGITDNTEMTRAKIFVYSLDHIRCRHLMLERLGLYSAPDNRGRFTMRNPKLERIVDSTDGRFAEKIARISAEELKVFARTLLEEVEEEKLHREDDSDSDKWDDNEDEDSDDDNSSGSEDAVEDEADPFDFDKVDFTKKR